MFDIHVSFIVYIWASSHDDWDLSIVEEANWKFGMTTFDHWLCHMCTFFCKAQ